MKRRRRRRRERRRRKRSTNRGRRRTGEGGEYRYIIHRKLLLIQVIRVLLKDSHPTNRPFAAA